MGRRVIGAVVAIFALGAIVSATTIVRRSLPEVESFAAEIFAGTVRSKRTVEDEGGRLFTEVTFGNLEVLKGEVPAATLTYRFAGGTKGDRTQVVVGIPEFETGERYVLFTNARRDLLCPLVGWTQGRYTVLPEGLGDSAGRPVYRFAEGFPVLVPEREGDPPMRVSAFLDHVRGIIRRRSHTEEVPEGEEGAR